MTAPGAAYSAHAEPAELLRDSVSDAALDMAVSHALLHQVARAEIAPIVRIYQPEPTLAFGRTDRFPTRYHAAVEAARGHGFAPVMRLAGGRAAAYDGASLVYEEIVADPAPLLGVRPRFHACAELLREALIALGADARIGELPAEYCPGEFSVNVGGRTKIVGIAQRAIRGAALVSASIIVGRGAAVRAVLADVYDALGIGWDTATAGALADELPCVSPDDVQRTVLEARGRRGYLEPRRLEESTLGLAYELVGQHVIPRQ